MVLFPMSRKAYDAKRRALAFRIWRESNQNESETLRRLRAEYEWPLSRQTLYDWREGEGWVARAAALEAGEAQRKRAEALDRASVLASLELQRQRYEDYFGTLAASGGVDTKATGAYANLARVILSIQREMDEGAGLNRLEVAMEVVQALSQYLAEHYAEKAGEWLEILEPFGVELAQRYGGVFRHG